MVKTKEEQKQYRKIINKKYNSSPNAKMVRKIRLWKHSGLVCQNRDEYEYIYDRWLRSERCEETKCNKEYTKENKKCMDHCHLTGLFRNILCNSCNSKRREKENSSGTTNITWCNIKNSWKYRIVINKKLYQKQSKDLEWLKNYKKEYENKYLYNI